MRRLGGDQEIRAAGRDGNRFGRLAAVLDARMRGRLRELRRGRLGRDDALEVARQRDGRLAVAGRDVDGEPAPGAYAREPFEERRGILGPESPVGLRLERRNGP